VYVVMTVVAYLAIPVHLNCYV